MRILITGRDGQVGWELERTLAGLGEIAAFGRAALDLGRPDALGAALDAFSPDVIVNAAAYTAVDQAESDERTATAVNADSPAAMADWASARGAVLIHYSTDYVFDGSGHTPWREEDAARPLSVYGRTKLAGEEAIRASGCRHLILRTSWVYAARGRNFVRTVLRLAREREELRIVDDQIGAPTWARTVAQVTGHVLARTGTTSAQRSDTLLAKGGTYHLTARGECSWFEFARHILDTCPDSTRALRRLVPIPSSAYPAPAARPRNSRLSVDRIEAVWNLAMPRWDSALSLCLAEYAA